MIIALIGSAIAFVNASPMNNATAIRGWWGTKNGGSGGKEEDTLRAPIYREGERSPEEYAEEFEGDIRVTENDRARFAKTGIVGENYRWPNAVIPYQIESRYSEK